MTEEPIYDTFIDINQFIEKFYSTVLTAKQVTELLRLPRLGNDHLVLLKPQHSFTTVLMDADTFYNLPIQTRLYLL